MKKIILIGGGTFSYVRNHLALAAPAFGKTVYTLSELLNEKISIHNALCNSKSIYSDDWNLDSECYGDEPLSVELYLTRMVDPDSILVTNDDISKFVDTLITDKNVRAIVFNPALVDFDGQIGDIPSGKYAERMRTDQGEAIMKLTPADKIIGKIRKHRKDIFVVGFKTTNGATSNEQFKRGLELLKTNSLNLVVANDPKTHNNMIITPEETRYSETIDRHEMLSFLTEMLLHRMHNTFTRSTVVPGEAVDWNGPEISDTLRTVVNHCIAKGAYKPFLGKTVGHFATKVSGDEIITSIRKSNFNDLDKNGMVRVKYEDDINVIAYGAKPSVGGQSQRIIFEEHPEMDSIVHFHCMHKKNIGELTSTGKVDEFMVMTANKNKGHLYPDLYDDYISVKPQWYNECGSRSCGQNTSDGLCKVDLGDGDIIKVVYLDNHGPNIVFNSKINPQKVINYIDRTFDLSSKTGGLFQ